MKDYNTFAESVRRKAAARIQARHRTQQMLLGCLCVLCLCLLTLSPTADYLQSTAAPSSQASAATGTVAGGTSVSVHVNPSAKEDCADSITETDSEFFPVSHPTADSGTSNTNTKEHYRLPVPTTPVWQNMLFPLPSAEFSLTELSYNTNEDLLRMEYLSDDWVLHFTVSPQKNETAFSSAPSQNPNYTMHVQNTQQAVGQVYSRNGCISFIVIARNTTTVADFSAALNDHVSVVSLDRWHENSKKDS